MTKQAEIEKVLGIVNKARIGMFTTIDQDGMPLSRPLTIQQADENTGLWFLTRDDTSQVSEVKQNSKVNVSFGHGTDWASVSGHASTLKDVSKIRELWHESNTAFVPDGPETPGLILIRVELDSAEYWETPGGVASLAFRWVKARLTHTQANPGKHNTIEL